MNDDGSTVEARTQVARIDKADRASRIQRWQELRVLSDAREGQSTWSGGGQETFLARSDAIHAYFYGCFFASLLASHVACERFLAGLVVFENPRDAPRGWNRWGLGRLAPWAVDRGWIDAAMGKRLLELAEIRNNIGHYRAPGQQGTLVRRLVAGFVEDEGAPHYQDLLRQDAYKALHICQDLLLRGYGPFGGM